MICSILKDFCPLTNWLMYVRPHPNASWTSFWVNPWRWIFSCKARSIVSIWGEMSSGYTLDIVRPRLRPNR